MEDHRTEEDEQVDMDAGLNSESQSQSQSASEAEVDLEESKEQVPVSARLDEISEIEQKIVLLLQEAAAVTESLLDQPKTDPVLAGVRSESDASGPQAALANHAASYLDLLEDISVRLRRNVRALEEEQVPYAPLSVWSDRSGVKEVERQALCGLASLYNIPLDRNHALS